MSSSPLKSKHSLLNVFRIRLAQLTNKCSDDDIEYYIRECGDILGVAQHVNNPDDPKAILYYIFQEVFKYKCSSSS
jgi:intraflagellar transport protein 52